MAGNDFDTAAESLVRQAVHEALRRARNGEFSAPHEFTTTPDGVPVLCATSADLQRFIFDSDPGRDLFDWLPAGNRRGAAFRGVLAAAGWLVVAPSGRPILRDMEINGARHPLAVLLRTRGAA